MTEFERMTDDRKLHRRRNDRFEQYVSDEMASLRSCARHSVQAHRPDSSRTGSVKRSDRPAFIGPRPDAASEALEWRQRE